MQVGRISPSGVVYQACPARAPDDLASGPFGRLSTATLGGADLWLPVAKKISTVFRQERFEVQICTYNKGKSIVCNVEAFSCRARQGATFGLRAARIEAAPKPAVPQEARPDAE